MVSREVPKSVQVPAWCVLVFLPPASRVHCFAHLTELLSWREA
ncbi:rCG58525 [Rattus norvegicus]|uniref:RCG58525 n=1 Tax=Rattus norvegicus TaxID=10116 RepID=A6K6T2_RAT|nr:rCG58525 [Rattus norvegicus]